MCMYRCVSYVYRCRGQRDMSGHLELELQAALSCAAVVPRTECASSLRIASVLHHWVISPAPISIFFFWKTIWLVGLVDRQTDTPTHRLRRDHRTACPASSPTKEEPGQGTGRSLIKKEKAANDGAAWGLRSSPTTPSALWVSPSWVCSLLDVPWALSCFSGSGTLATDCRAITDSGEEDIPEVSVCSVQPTARITFCYLPNGT